MGERQQDPERGRRGDRPHHQRRVLPLPQEEHRHGLRQEGLPEVRHGAQGGGQEEGQRRRGDQDAICSRQVLQAMSHPALGEHVRIMRTKMKNTPTHKKKKKKKKKPPPKKKKKKKKKK